MELPVDRFQKQNIVLHGERLHADRRRLDGFVRCGRGSFKLLGHFLLSEDLGRSRRLVDLGSLGEFRGFGGFCGFGDERRLGRFGHMGCFDRPRLLGELGEDRAALPVADGRLRFAEAHVAHTALAQTLSKRHEVRIARDDDDLPEPFGRELDRVDNDRKVRCVFAGHGRELLDFAQALPQTHRVPARGKGGFAPVTVDAPHFNGLPGVAQPFDDEVERFRGHVLGVDEKRRAGTAPRSRTEPRRLFAHRGRAAIVALHPQASADPREKSKTQHRTTGKKMGKGDTKSIPHLLRALRSPSAPQNERVEFANDRARQVFEPVNDDVLRVEALDRLGHDPEPDRIDPASGKARRHGRKVRFLVGKPPFRRGFAVREHDQNATPLGTKRKARGRPFDTLAVDVVAHARDGKRQKRREALARGRIPPVFEPFEERHVKGLEPAPALPVKRSGCDFERRKARHLEGDAEACKHRREGIGRNRGKPHGGARHRARAVDEK